MTIRVTAAEQYMARGCRYDPELTMHDVGTSHKPADASLQKSSAKNPSGNLLQKRIGEQPHYRTPVRTGKMSTHTKPGAKFESTKQDLEIVS
jgi:hypothetical protein